MEIGELVPEKILDGFLPYMGYLCHVTQMPNNFCSPYPRGLHTKFGFDWRQAVSEKMFEIVDNGHRTILYTISSPEQPSAQVS